MSRERANTALHGDAVAGGLATGVAWLPAEALAEPPDSAHVHNDATARAAIAASLSVDLAFVAATEPDAIATVEALHTADIAAVWSAEGTFGRVAAALGWMESLRMTVAAPGALAARLDSALHDALVDMRIGLAAGADAVLVADDLAGPAGPLLSPDYAHDALLPCYRRLALEAVEGGVPAIFHSDGDIRALIPALSRAGFAAIHVAVALVAYALFIVAAVQALLLMGLEKRLHLFAAVPTLKYLALSGRVGKFMAGMANALDIKPVLTVRDGSLVLLERVRTQKKAVERMLELVDEALAGNSIQRLALIHVNNEEGARALQGRICQAHGYTGEVLVVPFTPGLSVHAGTGVVGVVIQTKAG